MDPDSNLDTQLLLAEEIIRAFDGEQPIDADGAYALAEHVTALHAWILRGGFLPALWKRAR